MAKVGFYGGTFDPLHFGHINFALSIKEKKNLDEVWVCPTAHSPLKLRPAVASYQARLAMCRLGFGNLPGFSVIDLEGKEDSYTIHSLENLRKRHPEHQFFLLLGSDLLGEFHLWKDSERLKKEFHPLVGGRPPYPAEVSGIETVTIPQLEISSTEVRKRIKGGLYIEHLVPLKIVDYILMHQLYF